MPKVWIALVCVLFNKSSDINQSNSCSLSCYKKHTDKCKTIQEQQKPKKSEEVKKVERVKTHYLSDVLKNKLCLLIVEFKF